MALSSPWLTSHTLEDFLVMDRRRTRPGSSSLGEGLGLCKSPGCNLRSFSYGEKSTHCPEGPSPFPAPYTPDLRRKTPPCLLFQASISSIPGVSSLACPRANGVRASAVKGKGLSADSRGGNTMPAGRGLMGQKAPKHASPFQGLTASSSPYP